MKRETIKKRTEFAAEVAQRDAERATRRALKLAQRLAERDGTKRAQRRARLLARRLRRTLTRASNPAAQTFPMRGPERAAFGAIVSFEGESGRHRTLHRTGPVLAAVRCACADALEEDSSYLVTAISTPATIYGDLNGRFAGVDERDRSSHRHPEGKILGRAGYPHLLHPRLYASSHKPTRPKERT